MNQIERPADTKMQDITSSLLSAANLSVERLPILKTMFEDVGDCFLDNIQVLSSPEVEVSLQGVQTLKLNQAPIHDNEQVVVLLEMSENKPAALVSLDRLSLFLLLEFMLGASGKEKPYLEAREFTVLEHLFAKTIADRLSKAFCQVFSKIADFNMTTASSIQGDQIDTVMDSQTPFVYATFDVDVFGRSGSVRVFVPQAILAPYKTEFVIVKSHDPGKADKPWVDHIKSQLEHTDMLCQASLDGGKVSLETISRLKIGQILELNIPADSPVRFSSNEKDLYWCDLGKSDGAFTLKIIGPIQEKKDFLDEAMEKRQLTMENQI